MGHSANREASSEDDGKGDGGGEREQDAPLMLLLDGILSDAYAALGKGGKVGSLVHQPCERLEDGETVEPGPKRDPRRWRHAVPVVGGQILETTARDQVHKINAKCLWAGKRDIGYFHRILEVYVITTPARWGMFCTLLEAQKLEFTEEGEEESEGQEREEEQQGEQEEGEQEEQAQTQESATPSPVASPHAATPAEPASPAAVTPPALASASAPVPAASASQADELVSGMTGISDGSASGSGSVHGGHEGGLEYGGNAGEVVADNMEEHGQEPAPGGERRATSTLEVDEHVHQHADEDQGDNDAPINSDNDGNGTEVTQAASGQDADVDTGLSETEKATAPKGPQADPAAGAETGLRTDKEKTKGGASGSKQTSAKTKGGKGGSRTSARGK